MQETNRRNAEQGKEQQAAKQKHVGYEHCVEKEMKCKTSSKNVKCRKNSSIH